MGHKHLQQQMHHPNTGCADQTVLDHCFGSSQKQLAHSRCFFFHPSISILLLACVHLHYDDYNNTTSLFIPPLYITGLIDTSRDPSPARICAWGAGAHLRRFAIRLSVITPLSLYSLTTESIIQDGFQSDR